MCRNLPHHSGAGTLFGGKLKTLILIATCLASSVVSTASTLTYNGTIAETPSWDRPFGIYTNGISSSGVGAGYSYAELTVDWNGTYTFVSTATGGWDNLAFLYQDSFSPTDQLTNIIAGNDDYLGKIGLSGFAVDLTTDKNYFFVIGAFDATVTGDFVNTVSFNGKDDGQIGSATLVPPAPEPATVALFGAGLLGLMLRARKKSL